MENKDLENKDEKIKELGEKLEAEGKKLLPLPQLSPSTLSMLRYDASQLMQLHQEIYAKKLRLEEQNKLISSRVEALKAAKKIHINEHEFDQSQKSIAKYIELLSVIESEVGSELSYFSQFYLETLPPFLAVSKDDSDDAIAILTQKSSWIKKYVKTIRKDLAISYSRYEFGFETQLKRLDYVEGYIQTLG